MKLINFLFTIVLASGLIACNEQTTQNVNPNNDSVEVKTVSFAYVDMDTLQSKYNFYIQCRAELEKVYNNYQSTLAKKENALQAKVIEFQKKAQEGRFLNEEEFNQAQSVLANEQANLEQLSQKYMQQYAQKELAITKDINDSIKNFLAEYNAKHQYTMIFYKAVILHCDNSLDITEDVLKGLNERFDESK
jgi:outer membrane protein